MGLIHGGIYTPTMENQMEKNMETEMEAGIMQFIGLTVWYEL